MFDPAIRCIPFKVGSDYKMHTLSRVGALLHLKISVAGVETIEVPYGPVECYYLEMGPAIWFMPEFVEQYVPKIKMWYA